MRNKNYAQQAIAENVIVIYQLQIHISTPFQKQVSYSNLIVQVS